MYPSDTNEEAAAAQVSALQAMSTSKRFALTIAISEAAINLSKRAIALANPGITEQEVRFRFIELHYGKQLAEDVRTYVAKQKRA